MKITKVYTRTGDSGTTGLVGGVRIKKSDVRIEAYGTVDELSCQLGLLASQLNDGHEKNMIFHIQNNLFNVCSYLATDTSQTPVYNSAKLPDGEIELLENEIDTIIGELPERQGFILPGGTTQAALAHVARAVCRRAERRIVALAETTQLAPEMQQYVNRLSDYLFVLAKKLNFIAGHREKTWKKSCE